MATRAEVLQYKTLKKGLKLKFLAADVVVFHRSGDPRGGLHGNSALWRPTPESHRIALVLYQTEVKVPEGANVTLPGGAAAAAR